ncbi:hypothetical protein [Streptomyces sp. HNM0574]|uniref:hypothetical protein n=1 Tax=Streptomyces sp. HNM0574 TaxID=2714954 RepID=UPI0032173DFC
MALLIDGSEPEPVHLDIGSGARVHKTSEWWVYDGTLGTQRAASVRGACSCGWRGRREYPIDWSCGDADVDPAGPYGDWQGHVDEVEGRSVPLPAGLEALLQQTEERLTALAEEAPLAALRAVALLEGATSRIARDAAGAVRADGLSWESVGQGLGLTEQEARARLGAYQQRP